MMGCPSWSAPHGKVRFAFSSRFRVPFFPTSSQSFRVPANPEVHLLIEGIADHQQAQFGLSTHFSGKGQKSLYAMGNAFRLYRCRTRWRLFAEGWRSIWL